VKSGKMKQPPKLPSQYGLAHGKRLIPAAEVVHNLAPIGAIRLTHESKVCPLTKLEPEQQQHHHRVLS
jgi:hypothetical protein